MTASLIAGIVWVVVATFTAMLPIRRQGWTGLPLLAAAPVLIVWLSIDHGWWLGAFAVFAFLSMFRRPLIYLIRKAAGLPTEEIPR
ncbi:DUF2484 family protein [Pelagovum pacificum]|uniref:DUF2484 family protein n=1 Tax=Pelagovum pacificum TaxID=2588711 RepID=A0A5C5G7M5_9RHOB|nr:DUF2484 family protein [Pelagovum pacificum]QQA41843.1 DUF2484 family protein [Pelagovum pacificum]TNY30714.1 DUF2484 family protein [Pelagovum pacificum]